MPRRLLATVLALAALSVAAGLLDPVERFEPGHLFVAGGEPGLYAFDREGVSVPSSLTGLASLTGLSPLTGLGSIHDLVFGPEGLLYVSDTELDAVLVYGAFGAAPLAVFGAEGSALDEPTDLAFGPHGDLFVASAGQDVVLRFDRSGAVVDTLGPGLFLDDPRGLVFRADGHLFISSHGTDEVVELDPSGVVVARFGPGTPLDGPYGLAFGRDGLLRVASHGSDEVLVLDGAGQLVASLGPGTGLSAPTALGFGPDGHLYVASSGSDRVLVLDDAGVLVDEIGGDTALTAPTGLAFAPHVKPVTVKGSLTLPDGSDKPFSSRAAVVWSPGSGVATLLLLEPDDPLAAAFGSDVMTFAGHSAAWDKGRAYVGLEFDGSARAGSWGVLGLESRDKSGETDLRKLVGSLQKGGPEGSVQARIKGR